MSHLKVQRLNRPEYVISKASDLISTSGVTVTLRNNIISEPYPTCF